MAMGRVVDVAAPREPERLAPEAAEEQQDGQDHPAIESMQDDALGVTAFAIDGPQGPGVPGAAADDADPRSFHHRIIAVLATDDETVPVGGKMFPREGDERCDELLGQREVDDGTAPALRWFPRHHAKNPSTAATT